MLRIEKKSHAIGWDTSVHQKKLANFETPTYSLRLMTMHFHQKIMREKKIYFLSLRY